LLETRGGDERDGVRHDLERLSARSNAACATLAVVTATPDIPGHRIAGIIGEGGYATVYRGWQVAVGREVAVKVDNCQARQPGITVSASSFKVTGAAIPFAPDLIPGESEGLASLINWWNQAPV
jgi:hypothetical protein